MPMVTSPEECNCFAVRAAARHITQVYDQLLAPAGPSCAGFSDAGIDNRRSLGLSEQGK
jgi:hypothetical protein